tara:strand:+ start:13432 stop:13752 length:321 start_codon:yes stop_codon:yes gene_type:complete
MGSFLYKCSITHQTIREGEKVIVVPIIQNLEYKESNLKIGRKWFKTKPLNVKNIYPTDFWDHIGIYLEGEMSYMGLVFQLNIYGGQDHENELGEEYLKLIKYVNKK